MKLNRVHFFWLLLSFATLFAGVLLFQSRAAGSRDIEIPVHVSVDWSTRHLIFSGEPTGPNARIAMQDPRYLRHLHIYGHHHSFGENPESRGDWNWFRGPGPFRRREETPLQRDWQFNLGANARTGPTGNHYSYPAKFSFDINATPSCTDDFVVFQTGRPGVTGGQASIVALNELYSGSGAGGNGFCGTGQPSVMWAYNTNLTGDANGTVFSSPVLSLDGSKVAYVETRSAGAILKILKWVSSQGNVSSAVAPTPITTGNAWSTCPASGTSCLFSLMFAPTAADTYSSPFYNYGNDTIYLGDNSGRLHKFTGVFNGTPAEVTTGGWPFTVSSGRMLTGPVLDPVSGNIFVADTFNTLFYLRESGSTVGTCASGSPPCIGTPSLSVGTSTAGAFDPPTVDITTQRVFVYPAIDLNGNNGVIQATTALGSAVDTSLGSTAKNYINSGAFDQTYHSGNYSSGFLYACGTGPQTALFRIGFNSTGVMNSATDTSSVNLDPNTHIPSCTSMTEIVNGANDFLFFSLSASGGLASGCTSGCVLGLNLAGQAWPPTVSNFSVLAETGGTSNIVVDNVGTDGQESSVYFGPVGNNCASPAGRGCAVKATQSGLN